MANLFVHRKRTISHVMRLILFCGNGTTPSLITLQQGVELVHDWPEGPEESLHIMCILVVLTSAVSHIKYTSGFRDRMSNCSRPSVVRHQ